MSFYKNGTQLSTTQTLGANTALTVNQLLAIGGVAAANNLQAAEMFAYDSALSTSDRQAMEAYVSTRYAFF